MDDVVNLLCSVFDLLSPPISSVERQCRRHRCRYWSGSDSYWSSLDVLVNLLSHLDGTGRQQFRQLTNLKRKSMQTKRMRLQRDVCVRIQSWAYSEESRIHFPESWSKQNGTEEEEEAEISKIHKLVGPPYEAIRMPNTNQLKQTMHRRRRRRCLVVTIFGIVFITIYLLLHAFGGWERPWARVRAVYFIYTFSDKITN